jgi:hypothetical protein
VLATATLLAGKKSFVYGGRSLLHVSKNQSIRSSISVGIRFRNSFPAKKQGHPDNSRKPFILKFPKIASLRLARANSNL